MATQAPEQPTCGCDFRMTEIDSTGLFYCEHCDRACHAQCASSADCGEGRDRRDCVSCTAYLLSRRGNDDVPDASLTDHDFTD